MNEDRRRAPRYRLLADAEIVELRSQAKLQARTSDVSLVGCFMNSSSSFPQGTEITLKLSVQDATFTSRGVVERTLPMGMGVSFCNVKGDQQNVLRKWLAEVSRAGPQS
jgi:PilZ domain